MYKRQAPRNHIAIVTAGLKCAPEICPTEYIITIKVEAIANGANCPAEPCTAAVHIVRARKKVPMNSEISFGRILLSDILGPPWDRGMNIF